MKSENYIIVKAIHGSHAYGLQTPASDIDLKGVYFPSLNEVLLHGPDAHQRASTKVGEGKNTKDDVDEVYFSFVNFMNLARKSEMIAFDLMHIPLHLLQSYGLWWMKIVDQREMFYTKNMRSYMGYVRKQTAKYGQKGSRIAALRLVIDHLKSFSQTDRLSSAMNENLPLDADYLFLRSDPAANGTMMRHYEVLGSKFGETTKIEHVITPLMKREKEYGHRARAAETNEGVDWKAVSHAFRAGYQLRSMFSRGTMILPLPKEEVDIILPIKLGQKNWMDLQPQLEELMMEVNELSMKSHFPEAVDDAKIDRFIIDLSSQFYEDSL